MELKRITVLGAGLMGTGIAQVISSAGFAVTLRDISKKILDQSNDKIGKQLNRLVEKGKVTSEEAARAMSRITFTEDLKTAVENGDLIIEAVPENLELKRALFSDIDSVAKPAAIFASNTSELSIASLAGATSRKDKIIGTHWFFPPQVMKLIEVVITTVVCKDAQGFITSRAISALIAECLRIHEDGIASLEDIDKAMRLGFNHPMGPFQLADMSGLDVVYHSLEGLSQVFGDRFRPTETMARLVKEGHLGQKTGKGFYHYSGK